MSWTVLFFQTARGDYPVKEFIEQQELPVQARVSKSVRLLIAYGPYLRPPYTKKLRNNLYELRIVGNTAIRIFYMLKSNRYYLLHAFKKKSQKIPKHVLNTALDRMKEMI